jgi:protein SCO1
MNSERVDYQASLPSASRPRLVLPRRSTLPGLTVALIGAWLPAMAHDGFGPVTPPLEVPHIELMTSDDERLPLHRLLIGHATAVQLMFTNCRSICPIDAATLARVQDALGDHPPKKTQLLSLSIDPETDTPEKMRSWLERFGARPMWTAAAPLPEDILRVRAFFDRRSNFGESHSTVISLIDSQARLVWRTLELPSPQEVAKLLNGFVEAEPRGSER